MVQRVSKERTEKGKRQIKLCGHPGKHVTHNFQDLTEDNQQALWTCPGVGATVNCRACGTVNLQGATACNTCTLAL